MQTSLDLLAKAEETQDLSAWAEQLGLSKRALYTAKYRGSLSPAVAGTLAEALGFDPQPWIVVAALEGEKESACKSRMVRRFLGGAALAGAALTTALPASAATIFDFSSSPVCIMFNSRFMLATRL